MQFFLSDSTAQMTRNWTIAGVAAYRCELIVKGTSRRTGLIFQSRQQVLRYWLIFVAILGFSAIPRAFEYSYTISETCGDSPTYSLTEISPLLLKFPLYQVLYRTCFLFIVQSGGPVITTLIMSAVLLRKLKIHNEHHRGRRHQSRASANRMVAAAVITFILLEMPTFFTKIINAIPQVDFATTIFLGIGSNVCTTLESFAIFWGFIISNRDFRKRLFKLFF